MNQKPCPKYSFIKRADYESPFCTATVRIDFDAIMVEDMLAVFTDFLAAAGFQIQGLELVFRDTETGEKV